MEKTEQARQYEYKANSNLVLQGEKGPRESGPSSEVTSLAGKVSTSKMLRQMGDRVGRERPAELEERVKKAQKKREKKEQDESEPKKKLKNLEGLNVLQAEVETVYRPQTKKTQAAYEVLLSFIQSMTGDKPHDVLASAADEIISILKSEVKQKEKQQDIEGIFRQKMNEEQFARLVNIGKKITDFKTEAEEATALAATKAEETMDDEQRGVSVMIEDDEEEQQEEREEAYDVGESDDEGEGADTSKAFTITSKAENMMDDEEDKDEIDPRTIDAFWVQRQVGLFYKDPLVSQKMAEDVLTHLNSSDADGAVETKLVLLMDYEKFPLIKQVLRNRAKVVWCTKRARAQDEKEREEIERQMSEDPKLRPILDALKKTSSASERTEQLNKTLLKEAMTLGKSDKDKKSDEVGGDAFWNKRAKTILDLDSLQFDGGHFMSNKEVKLPKSEVITKKGYQEVHIPPLKPRPYAQNEKLVDIKSLPEWAQPAFNKMTTLNRIQSKVYSCAFGSAENMLLCAPTGAGKTNVAMLTMLREIGMHRNKDGSINKDAFKIIYIAPMKSLVQ